MAAAISTAACSLHTTDTGNRIVKTDATMTVNSRTSPAAIIYRTTRDYSRNVAVTLDATRTRITAFPDPADVRNGIAEPISLGNGYMLDRRGIGPTAAFLDFTYDEYAAMPQAPSPDSLIKHVVDAAPFTEMYALPITAVQAAADTARCRRYVAEGFAGCRPVALMQQKAILPKAVNRVQGAE